MAIAESDKSVGEVINIGTGKGISIGDLANLIVEIMDVEAEIVCDQQRVRPDDSEVMRLLAANDKARELTGWTPTVSLREGLANTIEFVKANLNEYKPDIYNV
jgi:nucleoside-diphosphate-sugar epimerase